MKQYVDESQLNEIIEVLSRYLPADRHDFSDSARVEAEEIILAARWHMNTFGVSPDIERLKEMESSLLTFLRVYSELEQGTVDELEVPAVSGGDGPTLAETTFHIEELRKTISILRKQPRYRAASGNKRNWKAISVARACRHLWAWTWWGSGVSLQERRRRADEMWIANTEKTLLPPEVARFVPETQRYDDPGPFGRMLEEVFLVLGIIAKDGQPVRAANALASLRDIERKENIQKDS